MEHLRSRRIALAAAGTLFASSAAAQNVVVIDDDFEVNSSADYTIVNDGTPDGTQTFAFDYVAVGIPPAPRSAAGESRGLRLTANDSAGSTDAWTLYHNTLVTAQRYRLTVDVWMNFDVFLNATEHAHVGVGGNVTTFNSLFTPISGSGAFIAFDGDGDSVSDYRWFRSPANTPPGETDNTTLPNSHPSYLGHGSNNTGPFFQSLFPAPPSTIAGSPGNIWTTVEIDVDETIGVISFYFDGMLTFQGNFAGSFSGLTSLGLADVFASISGASNVFTLYDNFEVEIVASTIGTNYCTAVANSTGSAALMSAFGSTSVAANDFDLLASSLPPGAFGYFLTSQTQGFVANPGGSQGNLCLGGSIGRFVAPGQIQVANANGEIGLSVDLTLHPTPAGLAPVNPGETWNYTSWYRDANPGVTSNFANGLNVTFN